MNSLDWTHRPTDLEFGPAAWQSRLLGGLTAVFVRPVIALLTLIGLVVNRFYPELVQRGRYDIIDGPFRAFRALPGTTVTPIKLDDCDAEWIVAPRAQGSDRVIIYFHGSALITLGLNSHRRWASKLSAATGARVLNVGYRLAPQALIEDAIADGVCAYRMVLGAGVDAKKIVFAGDSAGGLIATGTALAARDAGLQVPAGQILLSPLTSSDMNLKYNAMLEHRDVLFPFMAVKYLYDVFATKNGTHPVPEMPTEADLHGLGPTLLQVGNNEMLRNDSFALADALRAAGAQAWVQVWDKAMHMFQLSFDVNPDARKAVDEIVDFFEYATTTQQSGEVAS
ncbi:alpha/beta hydrolase [Mycolicibacterium sp. 141076]|uniref:alpha/beta hydrolase n=1 Tax=Mycobacteriaceae TaxID=1762 RepID=UPI00299CFBAE|nr:alpha/beta hydrolase [Mycolicibacterium sp. 141076]MDX1881486.1 alpha/beta hydrolase [Mycolicibacterium sp. 141076]